MSPQAITDHIGQAAIHEWLANPTGVSRHITATAVRYTTARLANTAPGRSVELRVPPFAAVQCIAGGTHTRGTPRAAIQTDPATWLKLAIGQLTWTAAQEAGLLTASGERADLSEHLPITPVEAICAVETNSPSTPEPPTMNP